MFLKFGLPLLALAGFAMAALTIVRGERNPPPPVIANTSASPYDHGVAGIGIVEPNTESIAIGSPVAGIVTNVFVKIGDDVAVGAPLFALDDRAVRADLAVRRAALAVARAGAAEARYQFEVASRLAATSAGPEQDRESRRYALEKADAQVAQADADVRLAESDLDRLTVRAPINGRILQLKLHVGEAAPPVAASTNPPLVLGNVTPLNVRVQVDEYDAPRIKVGVHATGFLRGAPGSGIALKFVRFEPVVIPKKTLTGDAVERTDTRVLEIIFAIEQPASAVSVGEQMDVMLEAGARE